MKNTKNTTQSTSEKKNKPLCKTCAQEVSQIESYIAILQRISDELSIDMQIDVPFNSTSEAYLKGGDKTLLRKKDWVDRLSWYFKNEQEKKMLSIYKDVFEKD